MTNAEEYLVSLLEDALKKHTKRKNFVRRIAWLLKISIMLLGMSATVLLGLTYGEDSPNLIYSRNLAMVCTAMSTLLASLAAMWNIDHYWLKRKVIVTKIDSLLEELKFQRSISNPISENQIEQFFKRYQNIMKQQTEYWEGMLAGTSPNVDHSQTLKGKAESVG